MVKLSVILFLLIIAVIYELNRIIRTLKIIAEVLNTKDHAMWIVFSRRFLVAVKKSIIIL